MTASPLLSVRKACRSFGGLQAVKSVSFDLAKGEILAIIGPNGAGKSTLFSMIAGQVRPDSGEIAFRGQSLSRMAAEAVARRGLVKTFQTSRPFASLSFAENVMVGALATGVDSAAGRVSFAQAPSLTGESLIAGTAQPPHTRMLGRTQVSVRPTLFISPQRSKQRKTPTRRGAG